MEFGLVGTVRTLGLDGLEFKVCNLGLKLRLIGKDPGAGKDQGQEEKGATEDEMVGWHHL